MIVVYRAWGIRRRVVAVRRELTGRQVRVRRVLYGEVRSWEPVNLEASELAPAFGDLRDLHMWEPECRDVYEREETLVGMAGAPSESFWGPGINAARCIHPMTAWHQPPVDHGNDNDPGCGFYGLKALDLVEQGRSTGHGGGDGACGCSIVGLAGLGGREVTEAPLGYRGSQAVVLALYAPPLWRDYRHYADFDPYPELGYHGGHVVVPEGHGRGETAASHLEALAGRYQVPVYTDPEALAGYAARFQTPRTWRVEDVPQPEPEPDADEDYQRMARAFQAAARRAGPVYVSPPPPAPPNPRRGGPNPPAPIPVQPGQQYSAGYLVGQLLRAARRPPGSPWWGSGPPPSWARTPRRPGQEP